MNIYLSFVVNLVLLQYQLRIDLLHGNLMLIQQTKEETKRSVVAKKSADM